MSTFHKKDFLVKSLKHWFEEEKRDFPWRKDPTPYKVWISEVMLQQTQAAVVVPYFNRWMECFPSIEALAKATIEEVMKLWEGLGYYARARSLHEGAQVLMQVHQGQLPSNPEELKKVKGIGPYTVGAILSFAFHQKAAAVDGNVARVMARLFCIEKEIDIPAVFKDLREKVETLLPDAEPWVVMEAFIELGARICLKKPDCENCPLQTECLAYHLGKAHELPRKKKKPDVLYLHRQVPLIFFKREFLVRKNEGKKVMAGLYEFPYFERETSGPSYPGKLHFYKKLNEVKHTFTRYRAHLFPSIWVAEEKHEIEGYHWMDAKNLERLPFSSGHRRILKELLEEYEAIPMIY